MNALGRLITAGAGLMNASIIHGLSTALVDRGPVEGTCLNLGCIFSKILIFPADRIMEIQEVAKGQAMMETHGFAKAVVQEGTGNILGFHIIGPHASILIQEVINAMASDATVMPIIRGMHIHPALSELIQAAIENLQEPDDERLDG